ncbi:MAG: hypothetical protein WC789_01755 [Lentisphaeria bacterium]|jgi:hypothetical protein
MIVLVLVLVLESEGISSKIEDEGGGETGGPAAANGGAQAQPSYFGATPV